MSTPAGWYDDGQGRQRWWDGTRWTDEYRSAMQVDVAAGAGPDAYPVSAPQFSPTGFGVPQSFTVPPPRPATKNFWGVLSLIAGIVGILLAWVLFGGVVGIAGAVFGVVGLAAVKNGMAANKGMNIWGIVLSGASVLLAFFFVVNVVLGVQSGAVSTAGPGAGTQTESPEPEAPASEAPASEAPGSGGSEFAFPVGDGLTMEASISSLQLDPPPGFRDNTPGQAEYDLYWDNAQETGGQLAVVTLTIHNDNDHEVSLEPALVTLKKEDLTDIPSWGVVGGGYDPFVFDLEIPAGESQTRKIAFVLPASEIDTVTMEALIPQDGDVLNWVAAVLPGQGQGCAQAPGGPDDPFKIWTCLQKK